MKNTDSNKADKNLGVPSAESQATLMLNADLVKLKGAISVNRPHGGGWDYVEITLVDDVASVECVSIRVGLAAFTEALTGLSRVDCEFDFRPAKVGMKHESKEENVRYSGGYIRSDERAKAKAAKYLKPFETDGWKGEASDLFNHHRSNNDGTYRVRFFRHVPVTSEQKG